MRIGATLARQNKHTAPKRMPRVGAQQQQNLTLTCQGEILEYDDGRITNVIRMTTIEIPVTIPDTSADLVDEVAVLPEWLDQLLEPLTPDLLLRVMKCARSERASQLDEWVKKRIHPAEQYGRYALGLEPSPGLSRALTRKLVELERYSE